MLEAWGDNEEEISSGTNDIPIHPRLSLVYSCMYLQNEPGSQHDKMSNDDCKDDVNNYDVVRVVKVQTSRKVDLSDPTCSAAVHKVVQRWKSKSARFPAFRTKTGSIVIEERVVLNVDINN